MVCFPPERPDESPTGYGAAYLSEEKYRSTVFDILKADWANIEKLMEILR